MKNDQILTSTGGAAKALPTRYALQRSATSRHVLISGVFHHSESRSKTDYLAGLTVLSYTAPSAEQV